ncbi:phasin family protein [Pontixanthobacter aestiaquae]|uniref:Phasin family protein n=1 Tax=Pontixanthobacter aestiaquae TaxID=1509367 RepID=A0A844Z6W6_9SPHN|nr:phasin family protein [Pontixanthobacter aestiaquae]MDN3646452.1 phasin family protein [Pontixanthobacter aestiaquae]MXO82560.1 phasin family protein [Pontixanthobacter aestiaquae]
MATNASKIDAAAEKAYAEAAAKKADKTSDDAKKDVSVAAIAKAVEQDETAPVKVEAVKKAVKAPAKKKSAAKKTSAKKKVAAKKAAPAKKATAKKTAAKKAPAKRKPAAIKTTKKLNAKDTVMTKAQTKAADYTAQVKEGFADLQERAKTAYDKGTEIASEMGEFTKGNVEAVVESGKILAAGVQDMGKVYVEDVKGAVETMTADVKEVAAVKSPTDFVQLQGKIARRNVDATVAAVSKNTEAWVKLANDAFAPLSSRASVAMDKVRKAA